MTDQQPTDIERARTEAAALLRLDPTRLSPTDALRCDLVATLRLAIDSASAAAMAGERVDLGQLLAAEERLRALLPADAIAPPENRSDPREALLAMYMQMRERGEFADDAGDDVNQFTPSEGVTRVTPSAEQDAESAIDVPTSDIVPPGERAECFVPPVGEDDYKAPKAPGSGPIIDGTVVKPKKATGRVVDIGIPVVVDVMPAEPWRRYSHLFE